MADRLRRHSWALSFVMAAACVMWGCTPHIYSPPPRLHPLETVAVAPTNRVGIQVEGGLAARVFGESLALGAVRARSGLTPELEASGELGMGYVMREPVVPVHRGFYSGRVGVKYAPASWFAIGGGLGGGASAAGGFVGPDAKLYMAYENPYFVPFWTLRGGVSLPIGATPVDISEDEPGVDVASPRTTGHIALGTGVRLLFREQKRQLGSLSAGLEILHMADSQANAQYMSLGAGLEWFID